MILYLIIVLLLVFLVYQVCPRDSFNMMELWTSHLIYTRLVFMAFFNKDPSLDILKERLLRNQVDIGNLFGRIYGPKTGKAVKDLLLEHIHAAVIVLVAIRNSDDRALKLAMKDFYDNADKIGIALDKLKGTNIFRHHMKMHIDTLTKTITSYVDKNYKQDIIDYDNYVNAGLKMAYDLSH